MVLPLSTSSSSSSLSSTFSDDSSSSSSPFLKFLYSYGGRILPRFPDGRLRYAGGHTRVLSVPRSVSFSEIAAKLGDLSGLGERVIIRCQLPTDDLDALVSVTSDEDLASLVEEYDLAASSRKIRVFLFPVVVASKSPKSPMMLPPGHPIHRCRILDIPRGVYRERFCHGRGFYASRLVHNGNYWQ